MVSDGTVSDGTESSEQLCRQAYPPSVRGAFPWKCPVPAPDGAARQSPRSGRIRAIAGCGEPVGELRSGPYDRSGADDTMGVGNLPRGAPPTRLSDGPHLCVGWPPSVPVEELLP